MRIYFAYVKALTFSGQSAASELVFDELSKIKDWDCKKVLLFPLDRGESWIQGYFKFLIQQFQTWVSFASIVFQKKACLHVNLGQSWGSFIRMGLPLLFVKCLRPKLPLVISLHGSVFMLWNKGDLILECFKAFLNAANVVTVLGASQRQRLIDFKIPEGIIKIVPNTSDLVCLEDSEVSRKHLGRDSLKLLHLSLLIESKGYPEYLEALELLAGKDLPKSIDAVLCGPMAYTAFCQRFCSDKEKETWILEKIEKINSLPNSRVRVKWVRGAHGAEKRQLFEEANVFVFPSRFPVEAQPLVLLEAMATGCGIITSTVGEIPSTVNADCAQLLDDPSADSIAEEVINLMKNEQRCADMGHEGLRQMKGAYSISNHVDTWNAIFQELS